MIRREESWSGRGWVLVLVLLALGAWLLADAKPAWAIEAPGTATTAPYSYDAPNAMYDQATNLTPRGAEHDTRSISCDRPIVGALGPSVASRAELHAPRAAAGVADDVVRFDPQWASRQLAGQNLPGSTGWATTPGGRSLSLHATERTFLGGPGRAPIDPGMIDDILAQGTRISYRGVNDTIRIGAPNLCGRCYVVVDAQNVNHIVTVMVPK